VRYNRDLQGGFIKKKTKRLVLDEGDAEELEVESGKDDGGGQAFCDW
jgi:hypothetical protein